MNDKDLVAKLKAIKAEVLALKQAHKRGLNRANFNFRWLGDYVLPKRSVTVRVTIEFESAVPESTLCILSSDAIEAVYSREWRNNQLVYEFLYWAQVPSSVYTLNVGILSARTIKQTSVEILQ